MKLRDRRDRDDAGLFLVEGYREIRRALEKNIRLVELYFSPEWFLGENEPALIEQARQAGAQLFELSKDAFAKCAYRDRPDGLLAVAPQWKRTLADVLSRTVPRFAIANTFPKGGLSSDAAVESAYLADPIAVHRTTARLGVSLFNEQARLKKVLASGGPLPVRTYVLHGSDDPIVPEWASKSLEGRANVTRRVYPGLHHETHNEPTGAVVIDDTTRWIVNASEELATR